jgi:hypothetical protein
MLPLEPAEETKKFNVSCNILKEERRSPDALRFQRELDTPQIYS